MGPKRGTGHIWVPNRKGAPYYELFFRTTASHLTDDGFSSPLESENFKILQSCAFFGLSLDLLSGLGIPLQKMVHFELFFKNSYR